MIETAELMLKGYDKTIFAGHNSNATTGTTSSKDGATVHKLLQERSVRKAAGGGTSVLEVHADVNQQSAGGGTSVPDVTVDVNLALGAAVAISASQGRDERLHIIRVPKVGGKPDFTEAIKEVDAVFRDAFHGARLTGDVVIVQPAMGPWLDMTRGTTEFAPLKPLGNGLELAQSEKNADDGLVDELGRAAFEDDPKAFKGKDDVGRATPTGQAFVPPPQALRDKTLPKGYRGTEKQWGKWFYGKNVVVFECPVKDKDGKRMWHMKRLSLKSTTDKPRN